MTQAAPQLHRIPLDLATSRTIQDNARRVGMLQGSGELPEYAEFVNNLFKELRTVPVEHVRTQLQECFDGESLDLNRLMDFLSRADADPNMSALHAAIGCAGEGGELLDVVKKVVVYGQSWDTPHKEDGKPLLIHLLEELADFRFYYQKLLNLLGINDRTVQDYSYTKLGQRYASGRYSDAQALERADKPQGLAARTYIGAERRLHNLPKGEDKA